MADVDIMSEKAVKNGDICAKWNPVAINISYRRRGGGNTCRECVLIVQYLPNETMSFVDFKEKGKFCQRSRNSPK